MSRYTYDDLHDDEVRVTDASSGGQKGKKLTQVGALDPVALMEVARVAGFGANKYASFNYLKGYDWSLSYNAGQRHANLFWAGEDRDAESGMLHAAMAAWHFLALVSFYVREVGNDDRPPRLEDTPPTFEEFFGAVQGMAAALAETPPVVDMLPTFTTAECEDCTCAPHIGPCSNCEPCGPCASRFLQPNPS